MARTIFYSWESDLPSQTNRDLIRDALNLAVQDLNASLVEAQREGDVQLDQDTQGLPGSPSVAHAILAKIDTTSAVVLDVSVIGALQIGSRQRLTPNPNVLVEYGYSLARCGEAKIVAVFNDAFGRIEDLPFDIRHKKVVRYFAHDEGVRDKTKRDALIRQLSSSLLDELRLIIAASDAETEVSVQREVPAVFDASCFVRPGELLGVDIEPGGSSTEDLEIADTPQLFVRVIPSENQKPLSYAEATRIMQTLHPPGHWISGSWGRNAQGAFSFAVPRETSISGNGRRLVKSLVQVFLNRELWAIDGGVLADSAAGRRYVPTAAVRESVAGALAECLAASRDPNRLSVTAPLRVVIGLSRVNGFSLAVGIRGLHGQIVRDEIVHSFIVRGDDDGSGGIRDFERKYWDVAGVPYFDT